MWTMIYCTHLADTLIYVLHIIFFLQDLHVLIKRDNTTGLLEVVLHARTSIDTANLKNKPELPKLDPRDTTQSKTRVLSGVAQRDKRKKITAEDVVLCKGDK